MTSCINPSVPYVGVTCTGMGKAGTVKVVAVESIQKNEHLLVCDYANPLAANKDNRPPVPGEFPAGSKVLYDKEISPTTGDEKEIEYE